MHLTKDQEDILLRCTAAIVCKDQNGIPNTGTSFWFQTESGEKYLITNRHVIENKVSVTIYCSIINELDASVKTITIDMKLKGNSYLSETADLGGIRVTDLFKQYKIMCRFLTKDLIKTKYDKCSLIEDVIMVGYPSGLLFKKINRPLIRVGTTASDLRLIKDSQDAFYLDIQAVEGSSGSPVFIIKDDSVELAGINKEDRIIPSYVYKKEKDNPEIKFSLYIKENTGISICENGIALIEFLDIIRV